MRFIRFYHIPQAEIELTWEEVDALLIYSNHHYDLRCKQEGRIGGMVWGFKNRFDTDKAPIRVALDAGELDLLMKISQSDPAMQYKIRFLFDSVNEEYIRRNK